MARHMAITSDVISTVTQPPSPNFSTVVTARIEDVTASPIAENISRYHQRASVLRARHQ